MTALYLMTLNAVLKHLFPQLAECLVNFLTADLGQPPSLWSDPLKSRTPLSIALTVTHFISFVAVTTLLSSSYLFIFIVSLTRM